MNRDMARRLTVLEAGRTAGRFDWMPEPYRRLARGLPTRPDGGLDGARFDTAQRNTFREVLSFVRATEPWASMAAAHRARLHDDRGLNL